ncbi:uncharacterized protein [Drosophila takahashii]|uniref:uncharacterized protein isoform X4 n=1 Tax=Drosophila takahashii TaxID=29030 RepID=UPI001CF860ED|nr:homeobox protein 12-like isoform X2 [Drosophila takahashii]
MIVSQNFKTEICLFLQNLNKEVANTISSGVQKEFQNFNKKEVNNTISSGVLKEFQNFNKKEVKDDALGSYDEDDDDDDDDDHDVNIFDEDNPEPCITRSPSEEESILVEGGISNYIQTIPLNLDKDNDEYIKSIPLSNDDNKIYILEGGINSYVQTIPLNIEESKQIECNSKKTF